MAEIKPKTFWQKPEGITGALVLTGLGLGIGYFSVNFLGSILAFLMTTTGALVGLLVLGAIVFMVLDGQTRALVSYMYKSFMRWITSLFIEINPIAILKGYVDDLRKNLKSMSKQIAKLRGQMHKLKEMIINNQKDIESNLSMAQEAKSSNNQAQIILKTRKAGRLQESNIKLDELYRKMEILYRVLTKMYENSSILVEDIEDQVKIKEQEYKAITAGNTAMKSAMSVIKGDKDKRAMFDAALEAIADDVSQKVGEMEQFMSLSENFMQSIDLQNGVFEEEGLKMLEKWENEGISLLLGDTKQTIIQDANDDSNILELEHPMAEPIKVERKNQYDSLFE
jgi:TolA-binding protein